MRASPAFADNLSIYFCCLSVNRAGDASAVSEHIITPRKGRSDARPILGQPPPRGLFFYSFPGRQRGPARLIQIRTTKKNRFFKSCFLFLPFFLSIFV